MRIKLYMALYPDARLSGQRYFELWPRVINLPFRSFILPIWSGFAETSAR